MPVVYCIFEPTEQHLLFFLIIIQQVDRQIQNELYENKPNSAFLKLLYDKMSFCYKYIDRKRKFGERSTAKASFYKQLTKIHVLSTAFDNDFL